MTKLYYKLINSFVEDIEFIDGVGDFRLLSQRAVKAMSSKNITAFQKVYLNGLVIILKSLHIKM